MAAESSVTPPSMRILLISHAFPPTDGVGARRNGKTAKFLAQFGHDIRVLTARDPRLPATLEVEIPEDQIVRTQWHNADIRARIAKWLDQHPRSIAKRTANVNGEPGMKDHWSKRAKSVANSLYSAMFPLPEPEATWWPTAVREGRRMITSWRPDLIYASALPFTSLLVANSLARTYSLPWIAEFRDPWADNQYRSVPKWRSFLELELEKRTLSTAAGIVTVSGPLARYYREQYKKPSAVIMNGYDPSDFQDLERIPRTDDHLLIVYTGTIYRDKRDPSALFKALRQLGSEAQRCRVNFYGPMLDEVRGMAGEFGVGDLVQTFPRIPYREALAKQKQADILLLLLWNDPSDEGFVTGKIFDYFGVGRPILTIGYSENVAAKIVKARGAGLVSTNPSQIAEWLRHLLKQKRTQGFIADLSPETRLGLTREDQTKLLEGWIGQLMRGVDASLDPELSLVSREQ